MTTIITIIMMHVGDGCVRGEGNYCPDCRTADVIGRQSHSECNSSIEREIYKTRVLFSPKYEECVLVLVHSFKQRFIQDKIHWIVMRPSTT